MGRRTLRKSGTQGNIRNRSEGTNESIIRAETYRIKVIGELYGGYKVGIKVIMTYKQVQRDEETRQGGYEVKDPSCEDPRDLPIGVSRRG
jgi:hypothetical protein